MSSFDCIMVCGYMKSGTTLLSHILGTLTDRKFLNAYLKNEIHSFLNIDKPEHDDIRVPCINFTVDNKAAMDVLIFDNFFEIIDKLHVELNLSESEHLLGDGEHYYMNYSSPGNLFRGDFSGKFVHKIFILRDFRDVYNSYTKFAEKLKPDIEKLNILGNYDDYQKFNYLNVQNFYTTLSHWKDYTKEYIKHRDEIFLVKYENLMSSPHDTLRDLCCYLDLDIFRYKHFGDSDQALQ